MKKQAFVRRFLCVLLTVLLTAGLTGAGSIVTRAGTAQQKYKELEKQLAELNEAIEELEDKTSEVTQQKNALNQQISILQEQISLLQQDIAQQQADIAAKQQEIDATRIEMADTEELFRHRIRSLYMMRTDGILTTVLGANTYAEALTAADTLQRITKADTQLLDTLTQQKATLEQEEAAQQVILSELQVNQTALEGKQQALATSLVKTNSTLTMLEAQQELAEKEQKALYEQYKAAKEAAEAEIRVTSNKIKEYVGGQFGWPVPGYYTISSSFGWRVLYGEDDYHTGVDITGTYAGQIAGAEIVAANDGYVTVAKYGTTGYGVCVYVDHGGGYITRYGHCSSLAVSAGDYVTKGQVIAYVGSTGNSTGYHLHFEIRQDGTAIDPMQFFS